MPLTASLKAIVYISAGIQPMTGAMLEDLLLEARRLNLASGVTGALIYSDGTFMQYFEGEPQAMVETYDRIRASRRHSRIVEMMNEPIMAREFPDWQMALTQPPASELLALSTASWVVQTSRLAARGHGSVGMVLLRNFWGRRRRPG
jgi:hypothetical protein